jgi:hypothetical protein
MNQSATATLSKDTDFKTDKKEQGKSLKTLQDLFDVGEYSKAVKYINMSKVSMCLIVV